LCMVDTWQLASPLAPTKKRFDLDKVDQKQREIVKKEQEDCRDSGEDFNVKLGSCYETCGRQRRYCYGH